MTQLSRLIISAAIPLCVAGCMRGTTLGDEQLASDGNEESAASAQSTNISNVVFSALTSQDPNTAAGDVAGATALWPSGCVTRAKDATNPLVATVTFKDCTGPFGLVHLNGDVVATFSAGTGGALHVDLAGKNLTANNQPLTYSATADVTVSGAIKNVTWHGAWTATTNKSVKVDHTSDLTLVVDTTTGCRTGNGTAKTMVETREVNTTVKDYKVCSATVGEACPTGTVTHTAKLTGKQITAVFDGSAVAQVTGTGGRTFDVPLICAAAQ